MATNSTHFDEVNRLKQKQVLKLVSSSFYKELRNYGINKSDIVSVSMNLLDYITEEQNGAIASQDNRYNFNISQIEDHWGKRNCLTLENVSIQPLTRNAIPEIIEWLQEKDLDKTFIRFFPKTAEKLESYLFADKHIYFGVYYKSEHLVGIIGAENYHEQFGKLEMKKFIGSRKFRNKGIGKAATFLFLYYSFHILDVNKVYIHSLDTNIKNINLNSRFGFELEGLLYNEVAIDDGFHDVLRMCLLKNNWISCFVKNKQDHTQVVN